MAKTSSLRIGLPALIYLGLPAKDALALSMLETPTLAIAGNRRNMKIATSSIQENRARVFRNPNEL